MAPNKESTESQPSSDDDIVVGHIYDRERSDRVRQFIRGLSLLHANNFPDLCANDARGLEIMIMEHLRTQTQMEPLRFCTVEVIQAHGAKDPTCRTVLFVHELCRAAACSAEDVVFGTHG